MLERNVRDIDDISSQVSFTGSPASYLKVFKNKNKRKMCNFYISSLFFSIPLSRSLVSIQSIDNNNIIAAPANMDSTSSKKT